ncbi:pyridoxamine 5'-phosphate oxidase family protein [Methanobrevibacter sp.]|uniref:pyridoxamine 5'-phosphate oxidase family protein n=1 Tax=Methanobrevibacter sp. TaxID=66852 RepID=UPI0038907EB2
MFRKMRRHKQQLSLEECEEILANEPRGVLALLGDEDYTYAIPMTHVYVDDKIYFHGAKTGHKNDAVKKHSKISYCVLNEGVLNDDGWSYTFKSVIVFGKIRTLDDRDEKIEKLTHLGDKFFPTHDETVKEIDRLLDVTEVFEITPDHITGKIVEEN